MSLIFSVIGIIIVIMIVIAIIIGAIIIPKKVNTRTCLECGTKIEDKNATQCPNCGNPLK